MIDLGKWNSLIVVKQVDFGLYLDGGADGEILLPNRYIPDGWQEDETLDVFIYLDSEDRPIATTDQPFAEVDSVATLQVTGSSRYGSFLNWGLMKDLFVPFSEQRVPMKEGKRYTVYVFIDNSGRIAASSKLNRFLSEGDTDGVFAPGEQVDLHIANQGDLGFKAVINGSHIGLLHKNAIFKPVHQGDKVTGYIQDIRADGKINLLLERPGGRERKDLADVILDDLLAKGGVSSITDKSSPEVIKAAYGVSKGHYKRALGLLYKTRKIALEPGKITLL